jgi:cytochrome c oxidase subunit II
MMKRRVGGDGPVVGAMRDRRRTLLRLSTILALVLMAAAVVLPHAVSADNPYTTISPRSKHADDIQGLYKLIFWMSLVVFVGVQAGIAYTVLRYRRRGDDGERPDQIHGNKTLEIAWTILPAIVLLVIFIPTVRTMYAQQDETKADANTVVVDVYAKQWWWEAHYAQPDSTNGVITANEIYLPAGKKVLFQMYSNNVIHSFWVPQLAGKMDVIPGHTNKLAFTPTQVGYYWGQCAEFCGDSHAWMRFKVIVVPQGEFDAWIAAWKAGPTQASAQVAGTGDVAQAPAAMAACLGCHRINGTNLNVAPVGLEEGAGTEDAPGPAKIAGPNLSLLGCRTVLAAGVLPNTPENLRKWLSDPGAIKPGNYMATAIKKGTLNDQQLDEIVGYLESLRPEGGCPPITGEVLPANVASPAADQTAIASAIAVAEAAQATSGAATAAASATAAAQPTPAASPPPQGGQPPPGPIEVDMEDIKFSTTEITIPANTDVTINLANKGAIVHNFNIDALNVHSGDYQPGQTGSVTINAAPGDYQYYCNIPGHKEAGMVGTLHVVAGGAPPAGAAAQPTPAGGAAPGGQAPPIELDLEDIKFSQKEFTIPANTDVTITLSDKGAIMHNFSVNDHNNPNVKNLGIKVDLNPGETKTVTINAPPGDYYYYCDVPGHEQAGMFGTMHVT